MTHFELVKPTFIENWPKELCSMSMSQVSLVLSIDAAKAITELAWDNKMSDYIKLTCDMIDTELPKFPKGAFIRLGSRSAKDCEIRQVKSGKDAMNMFVNSMRVFDDLCEAISNNYQPNIFLREWIEIPEWSEFRCFMKDRKLVGISQYNYLNGKVFPEIIENQEVIPAMIKWFFERFSQVSHLDDVVFDVYLRHWKIQGVGQWEVKLLEINPFFQRTDPCLFDWRNKELFNGQFLYNTRKEHDQPIS